MDREAAANSKAVHVRLPWPMWEKIAEMAEREASTVAAVLRRLAKERLDQIEAERQTDR
jgi:predicted DNA-binding ribbon-helix-helix protein